MISAETDIVRFVLYDYFFPFLFFFLLKFSFARALQNILPFEQFTISHFRISYYSDLSALIYFRIIFTLLVQVEKKTSFKSTSVFS